MVAVAVGVAVGVVVAFVVAVAVGVVVGVVVAVAVAVVVVVWVSRGRAVIQSSMFDTPRGSFPPPREFQEVAHRELRAGTQAQMQKQIVMAPTGAGKTYLALRVCNEALARGKRVLFICDRKTLINQTSATADRYGMPPHGIFQADNPRMDRGRPFQIASAQTIAARGLTDDFDVVVVDEAHTMHKTTLKLLAETKAWVIGLSATPFTKGLGRHYQRLVNAATMSELVDMKVLTPLRVLSCKRPDMTGAATTLKNGRGEYTAEAAEERGMSIAGDVVLEWLNHARALKTIVFGATIAHCEELVRQFRLAGIEAACFTAQTSDEEREALLRDYREPDSRLRVLVSVEALAKGFDVPDVGCVVDCRPLRKSLSTFIQMIGRGLRSSPGKGECLLLDHSGNVHRFADDFSEIYFNGLASLDAGKELDKRERPEPPKLPKSCAKCGAKPMGKRCVACGFEPARVSLVTTEPGEAAEVEILHGQRRYAGSPRELYCAIVTYLKEKPRPVRNPKGAAAHRYRELTGKWPSRQWSFDTAPRTVPGAELKGKLRSMEVAYFHRIRRSGE